MKQKANKSQITMQRHIMTSIFYYDMQTFNVKNVDKTELA